MSGKVKITREIGFEILRFIRDRYYVAFMTANINKGQKGLAKEYGIKEDKNLLRNVLGREGFEIEQEIPKGKDEWMVGSFLRKQDDEQKKKSMKGRNLQDLLVMIFQYI